MTNTVLIKRSATTATPSTLGVGELAYSSLSENLFIGESGSVVTKIGGAADVTKLSGIEAGAQVNLVNSVAGKTGAVTLTASDVGLANVDNTSDANKPVSTATQTAINLKANIASPTFTGTVSGITKAMVGLGNVDNTSDAAKAISTATQTALDLKAPIASPTFTGTVSGISSTMVGLGNVTNESKATMFTSPTFTGTVTVPTPTVSTAAANKGYVDSMALGITVKDPVVAGTTTNITLSGLQNVDGYSVMASDRVLVKNQTNAAENGIYTASTGAWSRSLDADNSPGGDNSEVRNGMFVLINNGTTQAKTQWTLSTTGSITLGTTELVFSQFGSVASYAAGSGLTLTGTTFAIDGTVLTTSSILDVTKLSTGTASAFNGSAITSLSASNVASGTLSDARLSANVLLVSSTIDCGTF